MSLINIGIIITYIMVFGAALAVVGFSVMQMIKNPDNAKKTIYKIGGLLFVCIVAYILSSLLDFDPNYWKFVLVEKRVGTSLYIFYILLLGAIATVLYTEFGKVFKK